MAASDLEARYWATTRRKAEAWQRKLADKARLISFFVPVITGLERSAWAEVGTAFSELSLLGLLLVVLVA